MHNAKLSPQAMAQSRCPVCLMEISSMISFHNHLPSGLFPPSYRPGGGDPCGEDSGAGRHLPLRERGHACQEGVPASLSQPLLQDLAASAPCAAAIVARDSLLHVVSVRAASASSSSSMALCRSCSSRCSCFECLLMVVRRRMVEDCEHGHQG